MSSTIEQGIKILSGQLADITVRIQDYGPDAAEAWIEETLTDKEARQLLVCAMIIVLERGYMEPTGRKGA